MPQELAAETRELLLRRTRVALHLGWSLHLAFAVIDAWRIAPEHYERALALRLSGVAALFVLLGLTHARNAARWAEGLAVTALLVMMLMVTAIMPFFQGVADPHYVVQGTGLVLCTLGAGLILPLETRMMLLIGVAAVAMHVGFTMHFDLVQNAPVLLGTVSSVVIATVAAQQSSRSRRADFEARRAKEELWRARADFVAMLTHDMKNPLAAVDGYVEMMRDEPAMPVARRDELLAHTQRAVRHAIALAVDFLDDSKVEANRFALKPLRTVDLGELLERVVADHQPHAAQKGVAITHDGTGALPPIDADPAALARVFANLLGNAIKHTARGGAIRVAAEPAGPWIQVVVEDTGEGITPGQETKLFERYTHAASRADSTGLGLYIARTITAAHGGRISAENRDDGQGARFRVVLPAVTPERSRPTRPSPSGSS